MFIDDKISFILADATSKCQEAGVDLQLINSRAVEYGDGTVCSGYFIANDSTGEKVLKVATGKPTSEWIPVLLHELSHLEQYMEQCPEWLGITLEDGSETTDLYFRWLQGEDIQGYDIVELAHKSLMVELDCEKRTLDKIYHYNLESVLDPVEYIMKANSYIYYYLYALETRRFYDLESTPYVNPNVWLTAPKTFDGDYSKVPEALKKAYRDFT